MIQTGRVLTSFNPTLVRLRPSPARGSGPPEEGFQSHAGSIEAGMVKERVDLGYPVSIPRWFD